MNIFSDIAQLAAQGLSFVIATVVEARGSSPQKPGARIVVLGDGSIRGTVGGGAIERQVVDTARELLADPGATTRLLETDLGKDLGMSCGGKMTVFLEKVAAAERLIIFGAGHVGKALAFFARGVGFLVTVADAREALLTEERFPGVERRVEDPREAARTLPLDERCYACVMTHDHGLDQEIVEILAPRPLRYLGVIGSRRKAERCRSQLEAKGFSPEVVARLRSPMGINIGGQAPEEIALSIAAELVAVRNGIPFEALQQAKLRAKAS
ncbi:MAG: xanthine dehydrogenase accessory protein XdhC [Myxococcales bacterium]|jgi:xanthine dehydrogenase accessory factor